MSSMQPLLCCLSAHLHVHYVPNASQTRHQHQGRKRQFHHVEGNFATHVYILAHSPATVTQAMSAELEKLKETFPRLEVLGNPAQTASQDTSKQFHLSLSRTVPIRFHQIDPLTNSLKISLKQQGRFQLKFCDWKVFLNDECTRTFLAIAVAVGVPEVCTAIEQVNKVFRKEQLQTFHEEPDPHISVAWLLGNHQKALYEHISMCSLAKVSWEQTVSSIQCCIGQRVFKVWSCEP